MAPTRILLPGLAALLFALVLIGLESPAPQPA